ncbi:hypothetical protein ACLOJK_012045 [Asimina triloba]
MPDLRGYLVRERLMPLLRCVDDDAGLTARCRRAPSVFPTNNSSAALQQSS